MCFRDLEIRFWDIGIIFWYIEIRFCDLGIIFWYLEIRVCDLEIIFWYFEIRVWNIEIRFVARWRSALNFGLSPGEVDSEKRLSPKTTGRGIGMITPPLGSAQAIHTGNQNHFSRATPIPRGFTLGME